MCMAAPSEVPDSSLSRRAAFRARLSSPSISAHEQESSNPSDGSRVTVSTRSSVCMMDAVSW